jgi:hypothetical protein
MLAVFFALTIRNLSFRDLMLSFACCTSKTKKNVKNKAFLSCETEENQTLEKYLGFSPHKMHKCTK